MTALELAARLVIALEGIRLMAYPDSGGVWTIGVGHTKDVKAGDGCDLAQALKWLEEDLQPLLKLVTGLKPLEAAALLSFGFNCGADDVTRVLQGSLTPTSEGFLTADGKLFGRKDASGNVRAGLNARRRLEAGLILVSRESD